MERTEERAPAWPLVAFALAWLLLLASLWWGAPARQQVVAPAPRPTIAIHDPGFVRELPPEDGERPVPTLSPDQPAPFRAEPWRLPNGMTAIVVRDPSAPVIAARIVVRAGAADDPPGLEGTAHLLEHLLFAGTSRLGTVDFRRERPHLEAQADLSALLAAEEDPEIRAELEAALAEEDRLATAYARPSELVHVLRALGATAIDARTGLALTTYAATIPANALEPWATLEAERLADPVLRTWVTERHVVAEEAALRHGCSCARLAEDERAALYGEDHPFGRPIGGTAESLARITIDDLLAFFDRWYAPENLAVVLVGDVDLTTARDVLDRTLGALPPRRLEARRPPPPAPRVAGLREVPRAPFTFSAAWRIDDADPRDLVAVTLVAQRAAALAGADGEIRGPVSVGVEELPGSAILRLSGHTTDVDAALFAVREAVRTALDDGVGEAKLDRARYREWVNRLRAAEDPAVQADQLAVAWSLGRGPEHLTQRLRDLFALDAEEVLARARARWSPDDLAWASGERGSSGARPPAPPWKKTDAVVEGPPSAEHDRILAIPRPELPPAWRVRGEDFDRSRDGRVVVVKNRSNTLFQADLVWPLGRLDDPALCAALQLWASAAARQPWARPLRDAAVDLDADRCTSTRTVLTLRGPGELAPEAVARVAMALREPALPDDAAKRWSRPYLHRGADDRAATLLFGLGPWPRPPVEVAPEALRRLLVPPDLRYSGPHRLEEVASFWPAGARMEPAPLPPYAARSEPTVRVDGDGVLLVRAGEPYSPAREGLYAVHEAWLADRIWELFRANGRSYAPTVEVRRGRAVGERNTLVVRVPSRGADPVQLATWVVEALEEAPSEAEFERIRAEVEAKAWSGHVPFRKAPGPLADAFDRGLRVDPAQAVWEQVGAVSLAELQDLIAREALTPPALEVRGRPDDPRLRELGVVAP